MLVQAWPLQTTSGELTSPLNVCALALPASTWSGSQELNLLAVEQVFPGPVWDVFRTPIRWLQAVIYSMDDGDHSDKFTWRQGRDLVTLSKAGDSWIVSCLTQGKLMGPRQKVYEAMHRQAKFAAWDVMAKVVSLTHNEDEAVEVAVKAAQWMRQNGPSTGTAGRA